jgi:hypothetical protein
MARICNRFRVKSTQILECPNFFMEKYFAKKYMWLGRLISVQPSYFNT